MTTLEQASAILKAAEEATSAPWIPSRDFERTWWVHAPEGEDKCPLHNGGRGIVESNTPTDNEENDIKFVALARNTAPAIALALIEKHRALEEALEVIESAHSWLDRWAKHTGNCRGDERCTCGLVAIRSEAAAFLARQGATA